MISGNRVEQEMVWNGDREPEGISGRLWCGEAMSREPERNEAQSTAMMHTDK